MLTVSRGPQHPDILIMNTQMSLHNMYTCLGDDDPDFKTRGGL